MCARCIGPRFLRWLRGIFMATVMTAHVQDSRRAVLLIAGADGLKHLSSAAEAGTSAFKFGTTEQPHSTGVHDAIAGQKLDAKAASRLLVSSIGGTQWTVVCAWLVLFLCDGRRSSSCHAGCCIGVLVCLPTCPVQRLIRALERPYQTFFKVLFEAHDGPRTMLVAQRVSQRASRQGSR